jgi:hypothetical protein
MSNSVALKVPRRNAPAPEPLARPRRRLGTLIRPSPRPSILDRYGRPLSALAKPWIWIPCPLLMPFPGIMPQMPVGLDAAAAGGISRVSESTGTGTTITIPTHAADDILIIYAVRLNTTPASLPAGWNNIHNSGASSLSFRMGWRLATSSSMTSGTWTNAGRLHVSVYRGANTTTPIGNTYSGGTALSGTSGSADTGAITLTTSGNWMTHILINTAANAWSPADITGAPTITDFNKVTAGDITCVYDSVRTSSYSAQSNFYTSSGWRVFGFEIAKA